VRIHSRRAWVEFTTRLREHGAVSFATEHIQVDIAADGVTLHGLGAGVLSNPWSGTSWSPRRC